jgi:putative ABC transport system ATP-binding protein
MSTRPPAAPAIALEHVSKRFGDGPQAVAAVADISLSIRRGEFVSIMGPSGCGKSTILHLIAGLTAPTSGHVVVDGADVATMSAAAAAALRRRRIGYVMQAFNLLPFLTVAENVGLPLMLDGVKDSEIQARVEEALAQANIAQRASHRPTYLSGGEQQRVAIARALVIKPAIILADEPTGNLDQTNGRALMDLIQDLNEDLGVTVLLVTHDPVFAARAQRVLRVIDGTLEQDLDLAHQQIGGAVT